MSDVLENGSWGQAQAMVARIGDAAGLSFDHITRDFSGKLALDDVNLDIKPGEIISLLGHSGSGKTTLLRIAAGIDRQNRGVFSINDQIMSSDSEFIPPEKRSVGLMFQDYALFPHLSILKNVMFGLSELPKKASQEEAIAALARVGLDQYANDYPHMLSGGQQQRVALARAIAPRPSVLLMDEPFSGLDNRLRDRVRDETLKVLREVGTTCIIVTHDPEEALRVSDRIVLLRDGQVIQFDAPEALYYRPADYWAARFFSELNEVDGLVEDGKAVTVVGDFDCEGFEEGQAVRVCIRHHAVKLHPDHEEGVTVSGRVIRRMFLGEVDLYEVSLEGVGYSFWVRSHTGLALNQGENIGVSFRKKDTLVFAKDLENS